jgi:hypothetical protein
VRLIVWHQTHYDATDKNNKVSSEGHNDNCENVCLYFHNWHYSIYIMQVTFIHGGSEKKSLDRHFHNYRCDLHY